MIINVRKITVFFLLVVICLKDAPAQSPFQLRGELEFPLFMTSFSLIGGAYAFKKKHKFHTMGFIDSLNAQNINRFDRPVVKQYSAPARYASDALLFSSFTMPLFLLADKKIHRDFGKIALMDLEVILLNTFLTDLVKEAVHRPRPLTYNPKIPTYKKRGLDNFKSFFSGHTSTVASQSYFFAFVYTSYNPHSKWLPLVWSMSAALPLTTALLRVKGGKHFWTDVITGYLVGAAVGVGVPALHRSELWLDRR